MASEDELSALASRLGALGLIPFVGLAACAAFAPGAYQSFASGALLAYGATIISFLGGVYWGSAISPAAAYSREGGVILIVSVIPQLLGWLALIIPAPWGHFIIAASLLALLVLDQAAVRSGMAPLWFRQLRQKLSFAAAITMITGALVP